MKHIIKLVILVGLFLQGYQSETVKDRGWGWSDEYQETVRLQTVTRGIGYPWPYWEVSTSLEIGDIGYKLVEKRAMVEPLNLSLSMGFWIVLIYLLDTFWPWEMDVSDA